MSLLTNTNQTITVYRQIETTDADGNPFIKPSPDGLTMNVMIQPMPQSGTSARRAEQDNEGFETEQLYRMRLRRGDEDIVLGIRTIIDWNGETWHVAGNPIEYNGSSRTKHVDYTIKRT